MSKSEGTGRGGVHWALPRVDNHSLLDFVTAPQHCIDLYSVFWLLTWLFARLAVVA